MFVADREVFVADREVFVADREVFVADREVFVADREVGRRGKLKPTMELIRWQECRVRLIVCGRLCFHQSHCLRHDCWDECGQDRTQDVY